jgi:hypothetical protein
MSENNDFQFNQQNTNPFIDPVSEYVSTDVITDLKSGIYNLFLSLLNNLVVQYGPVEAIKISTEFLDTISDTFKKTLE